MSTKAHYDDHLARFYSWMAGNFEDRAAGQQDFFSRNGILPQSSKIAFDLGAGHGLQAVPLARLGFTVKAFDFSTVLLTELNERKGALPIEAIEADFRAIKSYAHLQPELIICMGDTISHLESEEQLEEITNLCFGILSPGGKLVFSFRDYGFALESDSRFIPVKSDDTRIHTCFLEYFETRVRGNRPAPGKRERSVEAKSKQLLEAQAYPAGREGVG